MKVTKPKAYLIGQTALDDDAIQEYLDDIKASEWATDAPSDAEQLIEMMGRLCYRSFEVGSNPNVSKIREGNKPYLGNIVKQAHGSVAEHASVNFIFHNVSRVFTHELVRHRVGTAISQESLRFVRIMDIPIWIPTCFAGDPWAMQEIQHTMKFLEQKAKLFANHFKLDDPAIPFTRKKEVTSAMRRFLLTEGLSTTIGWSCNLRALKNILLQRTSPAAEEEIRLVFGQVLTIVKEEFTNIFEDLVVEEVNGYPTANSIYGKF